MAARLSSESTVSLSSNDSEIGQAPLELQDQALISGRRPSVSFSMLSDVRRSLSGSSFRTASLSKMSSRQLESFSVKEIYGDLDDRSIALRRSATRNTILDSLLSRVVQSISRKDEEKAVEDIDLYAKMPDTSVPTKDYGTEYSGIDPELVAWDGVDDPANPRNWTFREKLFQTAIVSVYSLLSPMLSSILSPAMTEISESLHIEKDVIRALCVSIMVLAWAIGPLIIAPISESDSVGRKPVLNSSIWIVAIFNLGCGFVKTPAQLCILRFLCGLGGCAPLNVGAGTLADIWSDEQRQYAMAAYSLGPTLGPVLAPVIGSFIATGLGWRWCFFILAIFNFVVAVFGTIFFKETYSPRLLKVKANKLRAETGNPHLHTIYEIADGESFTSRLITTVLRPISLLVGHPMVFGLGSFMAFTYGFMYLLIVTFPAVYRGSYHFSVNISGLMYVPLGIGFFLGTVFFLLAIEHTYQKLTAKNGGVSKPEFRLPWLVCSGIGIPIGLIWYGWSAQKQLHWIMPCIGLCIFGFALVAVFQTIQNYLIDMNNRFAASSVAAAAVFRSLFGFSFPLFANAMYAKLNYGWGNTMCAFIALALGIPFPVFCLIYGERLRLWANARFEKKQALKDEKSLAKLKEKNELEYLRQLEKKTQ
ncbi:hypothetical protein PUMCH_004809 [Australozyma saopauloensis]|uniref:Major facilitator superfamily (MFS) profile domain-containing protein n=1 Tax=Australozyma saopauloensis TaxID=291208 RepID=A0AAX4HFQ3_9ASCO|nr:hypothetical protein PUMCH_004809 [[Candida] saopauloensis]